VRLPVEASFAYQWPESLMVRFGPFKIVEQAPVMVGTNVGAVKQGSAKAVEVGAHELDTAFVGDAAVLVGAIEVGAAVFSDFERRGFVFVSDAHQKIVEAVRPDFPCEIGKRAVVGVEIVHACGVFAGTGRNGGNELAAIVVDAEKIERARQSSMSPDLTPMRSRGLSPGKAFGYSPWRDGWTNQTLPSAWARSAAWRSASLDVAGWQ
jgi:hypothetical protein